MQRIRTGSRGSVRDVTISGTDAIPSRLLGPDAIPPRLLGTEDIPRPAVRRRNLYNGEESISMFEILQQREDHLTPSAVAAMQRSREVQAKPLLTTARELEGCKSFS